MALLTRRPCFVLHLLMHAPDGVHVLPGRLAQGGQQPAPAPLLCAPGAVVRHPARHGHTAAGGEWGTSIK